MSDVEWMVNLRWSEPSKWGTGSLAAPVVGLEGEND